MNIKLGIDNICESVVAAEEVTDLKGVVEIVSYLIGLATGVLASFLDIDQESAEGLVSTAMNVEDMHDVLLMCYYDVCKKKGIAWE